MKSQNIFGHISLNLAKISTEKCPLVHCFCFSLTLFFKQFKITSQTNKNSIYNLCFFIFSRLILNSTRQISSDKMNNFLLAKEVTLKTKIQRSPQRIRHLPSLQTQRTTISSQRQKIIHFQWKNNNNLSNHILYQTKFR